MNHTIQQPVRVMRIIARMNLGGPAVQIAGLMRGIDTERFEQRLFTGFCSSDEVDYLETIATDIEAIRIDGFGRRVSLLDDIRAFRLLVKEIRDFRPHIVHTHTAKAGFLGRIASILSFHPSVRVHTYHGHLLNGYFGKFKLSLIIIAERTLALFTNSLLAVGNKVREDLLLVKVGKMDKFGLMPPGLSISTLPNKYESMESFGLSVDRLQCAFIGRVTQIKRPDRFLEVVSEVKKRKINVDFFIAGDGDLLSECQEKISKENLNVRTLGWQSHIEKVLSSADFVILTSDNEGTPLSLIQAGMAGLPVVATNVGSVSEVVLNDITGIVTGLDVQEISNAIERLVQDRELRLRLGFAAQKFTLTKFGAKRLVHDHEELYKGLLSNQATS